MAIFRQLTTTPFNFLALSGVTIPKYVGLETKKAIPEGFPQGFKVQRIGISTAIAVSDLAPADIATFFREHPDVSKALLMESCDKRFTPSTFISERGDDFDVGWFTRDGGYQAVQTFSSLADAATDYLLFSLGKGRWTSQL